MINPISLTKFLKKLPLQKNQSSNLPLTELDEVRLSGFFDADWYLDQYPDVKSGKQDPLLHFMLHGWKELRNPSALFNTKWYLDTYSDARTDGLNPFLHYIRYGVHEGRASRDIQSSNLAIDEGFDLPPTFLDYISASSISELITKSQELSKYPDPFIAYSLIMQK